jgi:hypothetical protein
MIYVLTVKFGAKRKIITDQIFYKLMVYVLTVKFGANKKYNKLNFYKLIICELTVKFRAKIKITGNQIFYKVIIQSGKEDYHKLDFLQTNN